MILQTYLDSVIKFLYFACMYYVIQLGRAVQISLVMLVVILIFRKICMKYNIVFFRGILWGILLLAPFMGRMRWIYETRIGVKLLFYWQNICGSHRWIPSVYVAGMVIVGAWIFYRRRKLKRAVGNFRKEDFHGIRIAVSDFAVSPFVTGLIHPIIVVPQIMLDEMSEGELEMIILHERMHIRLGHLWCFWLWDVLRVLLWVNPLLHICTKWFRGDLEDICDKVTIQKGCQSAYSYGSLLLRSIRMLQNKETVWEPSAAFVGEKQYMNIKHRIEHVIAYKPYNRLRIFSLAVACSGILILAFWAVIRISYPCYTEEEYLTIYNGNGTKVLIEDSNLLREAITIGEKEIYIDKKKLDCIFAEQNIKDDIVFLFFGGYSKIPGVGGGGNGVFLEYTEQEGDLIVPYVDNNADWVSWLVKYL